MKNKEPQPTCRPKPKTLLALGRTTGKQIQHATQKVAVLKR